MPTPEDLADHSPEELQELADAFGWFHSIDLGRGVRTKGLSELALPLHQLPSFAGRTVLDIGAWDGYYSYLAEGEGASRVVALDHYAWGVDFVARGAYWNECLAKGELPDHSRDTTDFWRPELPGRRGFEFAHAALKSRVEPVVADFTTVDLDTLGTFDVVLYLGVLYHMKEPLTCLERLRQVTGGVAVIETEAISLEGHEDVSLLQFYAGGELRVDFGNWYVPNIEALRSLCRAAGFSRVETVVGEPPAHPAPPAPTWRRALRRVRAGAVRPPAATGAPVQYRAVVHAYA